MDSKIELYTEICEVMERPDVKKGCMRYSFQLYHT